MGKRPLLRRVRRSLRWSHLVLAIFATLIAGTVMLALEMPAASTDRAAVSPTAP
ncbi:hypothetical protein GCM10010921_13380 [Microbacterium album]|uniref:Uncharacterized protein n=1 Tax=Microbacterium album TaxID=2053191 RepID=A0A917IEQ9_9MICO|nr:hypothetical protein GCM10010921_13380 [Microbacterium album]